MTKLTNMNSNRNRYRHPELPKTGSEEQVERFNPDGQAEEFRVEPGKNRYKHECGEIVVDNGFLVCTRSKYPHTLEVKNLDEFISKNPMLMKKTLQA